jgi:hypothetical protein
MGKGDLMVVHHYKAVSENSQITGVHTYIQPASIFENASSFQTPTYYSKAI